MDDIKKYISHLDELKENLRKDLSKFDNNSSNEFHKKLFKLIKDDKDLSDLYEFIVFITDNNNNKLQIQQDIIERYFQDIIDCKIFILHKLEKLYTQNVPKKLTLKEYFFNFLKGITFTRIIVFTISLTTLLMFITILKHPDKTEQILKTTEKIITKKIP